MKTKYKIEINAEWGSKFQKRVGEEAIEILLSSLSKYINYNHKNNYIQIMSEKIDEPSVVAVKLKKEYKNPFFNDDVIKSLEKLTIIKK